MPPNGRGAIKAAILIVRSTVGISIVMASYWLGSIFYFPLTPCDQVGPNRSCWRDGLCALVCDPGRSGSDREGVAWHALLTYQIRPNKRHSDEYWINRRINRCWITAWISKMNELLDYKRAAAYCRLPLNYFRNIVKGGTGPNYVKPSPREILFRQRDLDSWINTWADRSGAPNEATALLG
jgi:hypothetical protein